MIQNGRFRNFKRPIGPWYRERQPDDHSLNRVHCVLLQENRQQTVPTPHDVEHVHNYTHAAIKERKRGKNRERERERFNEN